MSEEVPRAPRTADSDITCKCEFIASTIYGARQSLRLGLLRSLHSLAKTAHNLRLPSGRRGFN